ncbi:hypothetical protein K469DRAFT_695165 [Zopfia rhizophila CBS 207.26]|uniref:Uncharacterized protein n=1 Tax=Zopfia rhizophila CBS 207.26 TaxID=1314779 RepID=A0A6A6DIT0_9PEZI|nr:hypothetical protein K469DRAFT_695165 [Zopfia rhizophila CBS 207.26]
MTASWLSDNHGMNDFRPETFPEEIDYFNVYTMYDSDEDGLSLLQTLQQFRDFSATDARDKVYGLLNLINSDSQSLHVNYGKTVGKVYAVTALPIIQSSSKLKILAYVAHPLEYQAREGFNRFERSSSVASLLECQKGIVAVTTMARTLTPGLDKSDTLVMDIEEEGRLRYYSNDLGFIEPLYHETARKTQRHMDRFRRPFMTATVLDLNSTLEAYVAEIAHEELVENMRAGKIEEQEFSLK